MCWQGAVSERGSSQITGDIVMTDKPHPVKIYIQMFPKEPFSEQFLKELFFSECKEHFKNLKNLFLL